MRTKALTFVLVAIAFVARSGFSQSLASKAKPAPYVTLKFTTKDGTSCEALVRDSSGSSEQRKLTISCGSKEISAYSTPDHILDIARDSFDGDRLFARWEGTTLAHLTVFHIEVNQLTTKATVVFDQSAEFMPDVPSADNLLVSKGKRFVGGDMLPTQTDVFTWNGQKYERKSSWKWNDSMMYEERFCVLAPQKLSCPVSPIPTK
jgi:hypothetical protein